jgi:hypothetical protein
MTRDRIQGGVQEGAPASVDAAAPGRSCGGCTLCCKVYTIPELNKPMGRWCPICAPGRGCVRHAERPQTCRAFDCLWITADFLGPEWKPDRSKLVLSVTRDNVLSIQVDPGAPTAWRAEPYHSQILRWAAAGATTGRRVVVFVNDKATPIEPA